jgi:HD-GYP domain-containing protein (c-di-GMP phosphodiesterase class II)
MGIRRPSIASWEQLPDWVHQTARSLMEALRLRDPYTYGHCRRVARHARLLAKAAGLSEWEQQKVEYAALFHDLGKIGIPDRVLLKEGKLTPDEAAIIREHPVKSVEIIQPLARIPFFESTIPGVLHHHERIDGCGYPYGLSGDDIPVIARIILIADTYDAMTTTRPYRKGLGDDFAYKELKKFAGRQFDPQLVKVFLQAHPTWGSLDEEITEEFVSSHFRRAG